MEKRGQLNYRTKHASETGHERLIPIPIPIPILIPKLTCYTAVTCEKLLAIALSGRLTTSKHQAKSSYFVAS